MTARATPLERAWGRPGRGPAVQAFEAAVAEQMADAVDGVLSDAAVTAQLDQLKAAVRDAGLMDRTAFHVSDEGELTTRAILAVAAGRWVTTTCPHIGELTSAELVNWVGVSPPSHLNLGTRTLVCDPCCMAIPAYHLTPVTDGRCHVCRLRLGAGLKVLVRYGRDDTLTATAMACGTCAHDLGLVVA